jgi:hypothetical protein
MQIRTYSRKTGNFQYKNEIYDQKVGVVCKFLPFWTREENNYHILLTAGES